MGRAVWQPSQKSEKKCTTLGLPLFTRCPRSSADASGVVFSRRQIGTVHSIAMQAASAAHNGQGASMRLRT